MAYPTNVTRYPTRIDKNASGWLVVDEYFNVPSATPYEMYLDHVPKDSASTTIGASGGAAWTEVFSTPTSADTYYVDYSTGKVEFHSGNAGDAVEADYTNLGDDIMAEHMNIVQDEIYDTQTTLGDVPQGFQATVSDRLNTIEATIRYNADASGIDGSRIIDDTVRAGALMDDIKGTLWVSEGRPTLQMIGQHINDTVGAHAATAISLTPPGSTTPTTVQGHTDLTGSETQTNSNPHGIAFIDIFDPTSDFDIQADIRCINLSGYSVSASGQFISLLINGPDADQFLTFYNNSNPTEEWLRWNDTADYFELSDQLYIHGAMLSPSGGYEDLVPTASGSNYVGTQALAFQEMNAQLVRADDGYFTDCYVGAGTLYIGGVPLSSLEGDTIVINNITASGVDIVNSDATTENALNVSASDLTTGRAGYFYSDSSDSSTRNLVEIHNDNSSATGTTCLNIDQDADNKSIYIDSESATEEVIRVDADVLTTGGILYLYSNSSDDSARQLLKIHNDDASATGCIPLYAVQDADYSAFAVGTGGCTTTNAINFGNLGTTSGNGIWAEGNNLTTGRVAYFYSNSSDDSRRDMVAIVNDHASATGVAGLMVKQDADSAYGCIYADVEGNAPALFVDSEATTQPAIYIAAPTHTTGAVLQIDNANALTTGYLMYLHSDSAETDSRNLVAILNDNTAATGTKCLTLDQDADQMSLYILSDHTTCANGAMQITANSITDGPIARFYSNSSDASARNLVQVINDNASASDAVCLDIDQDGADWAQVINAAGKGIYVRTAGGDGDGVYVSVATVLESNHHGLHVLSSAAQTNDSLVHFQNTSSDADKTTLEISGGGYGNSIYIANATGGHGISVRSTAPSGNAAYFTSVDPFTLANTHCLHVYSNADHVTADTALVMIDQDSASATEPALEVDQDGTAPCAELRNDGDGSHIRLIGDPNASGSMVDGDFWYDGTQLNFYDGSDVTNLLTAGGAGTANSYTTSFTNADLWDGVLKATHSLGSKYTIVAVYDDNDKVIQPDEIYPSGTNNTWVDVSSFGTISGTWNIRIMA